MLIIAQLLVIIDLYVCRYLICVETHYLYYSSETEKLEVIQCMIKMFQVRFYSVTSVVSEEPISGACSDTVPTTRRDRVATAARARDAHAGPARRGITSHNIVHAKQLSD